MTAVPEYGGDGLAVAFAHMSRDLLAQGSLQATLDRVCEHAVELVEGCESAGIMVLHRKGRVETAAATDDLARESDQIQADLDEVPAWTPPRDRSRGTASPTWPVPDRGGNTTRLESANWASAA
ncbi:hypothetical protein [Saccharopolyspora sp. CA-218241]|uniref:hypothetical protein n=1 Tax=Saccharopolyspora sp. CA-218241 TaxID=3240027 RepID=UPI003D992ECD